MNKQLNQNSKEYKSRRVMILHKRVANAPTALLAVGRTFTFPASKTSYTVQASGAVVRARPKIKRERLGSGRPYQKKQTPRKIGGLGIVSRGPEWTRMADGKWQMAKGKSQRLVEQNNTRQANTLASSSPTI